MKNLQLQFIRELIEKTFEFETLLKDIAYISKDYLKSTEEDANSLPLMQVHESLLREGPNTVKFRKQLTDLLDAKQLDFLLERLNKGRAYYKDRLRDVTKILLEEIERMRYQKKVKSYVSDLVEADQLVAKKLEQVDKAAYLVDTILQNKEHFDFSTVTKEREKDRYMMLEEIRIKIAVETKAERKERHPRKSKRTQKDEPSTYDITLGLLESGMTISEIANKRGLTVGTIEGLLGRAVAEKRISILKFASQETVDHISSVLREMPTGFTSKDVFERLGGEYGYGILRAVMIHTGLQSTPKKAER
jgi:hypothetical protein